MDPHDLTAAYALDALDADEAETYQRHLSRCEECREQLAELTEASAALAYASVAPAPPPRLRAVILETAAAERSNVVPLVRRNRWVSRGLAVAAAAVACVAVVLGVSLSQSSKPQQSWTVSVGATGQATLSVSGLSAAPNGKTYEAWIIPAGVGRAPRPAGLFPGSTSAVRLHGTVPSHAIVAVTVEPKGGSRAPTTTPIFSTRT
jgi:anti-sigma-K factor RskA